MNREEVIKQLADNLSDLRKDFDVANLSLFGSVARDQAVAGSDVDLLVDFTRTPGLLRYIELKNHLEDLLGVPVDLVTHKALKPQLKDSILAEAVRVN